MIRFCTAINISSQIEMLAIAFAIILVLLVIIIAVGAMSAPAAPAPSAPSAPIGAKSAAAQAPIVAVPLVAPVSPPPVYQPTSNAPSFSTPPPATSAPAPAPAPASPSVVSAPAPAPSASVATVSPNITPVITPATAPIVVAPAPPAPLPSPPKINGALAKGCRECGSGLFFCDKGIITSSEWWNGQAAQISDYRLPLWDPSNPNVTLGADGYYWRQGADGCPNDPVPGAKKAGCVPCPAVKGLFFCPAGILPDKQPAQISSYRLASYDPVNAPIDLNGDKYFWRQGATGC